MSTAYPPQPPRATGDGATRRPRRDTRRNAPRDTPGDGAGPGGGPADTGRAKV